MNAIFIASGIDDVVYGDREKPEPTEAVKLKTWKQDDAKAMFLISSAMDTPSMQSLLCCSSSKEMWDKLTMIYEQKSESNKLVLTQRFYEYRMDASDSVVQHVAKVQNMAAQLADVGEKMSEVAIMAKILASLPSKYNALRTAWDSVDSSKQNVSNLQERLIKEEARLSADDDAATAFAATRIEKKPFEKGGTTKFKKKKADIECYRCGKKGHMAFECPTKKSNNPKPDDDSSQGCAFVASMADDSCSGNVALSAQWIQQLNAGDVWLADSGASRHSSYRRDWFVNFTPSGANEQVILGDNGVCEVTGSGSIEIVKIVNGQKFPSVIENVLYVPKLRKNLFSIGVCTKKGYNVVFAGENVDIITNDDVVAQGVKQANGVYRMLFASVKRDAREKLEANVTVTTSLKTWHERFGHVNKATLKVMMKGNLVNGMELSDLSDFNCEPCLIGKSHRLPFQKSVVKKDWLPGEFVHSDVGGPMSVESIKGARLYLELIDEASGYRNVYFLKHKSDVADKRKNGQK